MSSADLSIVREDASTGAVSDAASAAGYVPKLGLFSATMLVVGGIIGSGIFLNPAIVAQRVGSVPLVYLAWAMGAVVALIGAFVFAELGARRPAAGGGYVYLRDAFGPLPAFLYGWALFLMVATGAIAAVGVTCASYAASLLGLPTTWAQPLAAAAIALLTMINCVGVAPGAATQTLFTVLKLGAIAALVMVGLLGTSAVLDNPVAALPITGASDTSATTGAPSPLLALSAALVPVLFAFGGWQQTNYVAEELRDPARTLPRALLLGVLIVVSAYMLVNVAYLRQLGVAGLAASSAPAADTMFAVLGAPGRVAIGAGIVASTFGFLGLVILVTPRVYQAMAADGLFFASFARLHPTWRTPVAALLAQGVLAIALVYSGTYAELLDYVVFADWIFFGLTAATVFVFRQREGRPARSAIPGHPFTTVLFIGAAGYVLIGTVTSNPGNAVRGAGLFLLGLPAYAWWRRRG